MKLHIHEMSDHEICHYHGPDRRITSRHRTVFVDEGERHWQLELPGDGWRNLLGGMRLARRALRLDKCNVVPVDGGLVIVRQGRVYRYDEGTRQLETVLTLRNCRNVLHQGICVVDGRRIYLGEYGSNRGQNSVPIHRSLDAGRTWHTVFEFAAGKATHVHGCFHDPFENRIWVLTGDFQGECHVVCADPEFEELEWIGDTQQRYRSCNLFFQADTVHWIMDSQLEHSHAVRLDRASRQITVGQRFPGPVWHVKRLEDGYFLAATVQEIGPGVLDDHAHLMVSRDLESWQDLHLFEHDGLPKGHFKFGVIGFADGRQRSDSFSLFGEALRGWDGRSARCAIVDE